MSIQGPLFQPPPLLRAPLSHQMLAQCCSQCLIVALIFLPATFCTNLVSVPFTSSPQSPYILERDLGFFIFISSLILPLRNSTKALSWGMCQPHAHSRGPGTGLWDEDCTCCGSCREGQRRNPAWGLAAQQRQLHHGGWGRGGGGRPVRMRRTLPRHQIGISFSL